MTSPPTDVFSMFDELDKQMEEEDKGTEEVPTKAPFLTPDVFVEEDEVAEDVPGLDANTDDSLSAVATPVETPVTELSLSNIGYSQEGVDAFRDVVLALEPAEYPEFTMPDVGELEYENGDVQTIDTVAETNTKVKKVTKKKEKIIRTTGLFKALGLHSFGNQEITLKEAMKRAVQVNAAKCKLTANMSNATNGRYSDLIMPVIVTTYNTFTGDILAPKGVGSEYGIVQYDEAVGFLENLIGSDHAELRYLSAPGTGCHLYVVLRAAGTIQVGTETLVNDFLVTTSHDGSAKLNIRITPTMGKVTAIPFTAGVQFRHSKNVNEHLTRASTTIKVVTDLWDTFEQDMQKMMACKITNEQAMDYFKCIVGDNEESTRQTNIRDSLASLYEKGLVARLVPNTVAAAYFAFVEWSNHWKTVRKMKHIKNSDEAELFGKFHGTSVREQTEGYAFAVAMTEEFGEVAEALVS